MDTKAYEKLLELFILLFVMSVLSASPEVCTNSLIPGDKGDQGEIGDVGETGIMGKTGPPGHPGNAGDAGIKGDVGHIGKMGPLGYKVLLGLRETGERYYLLVKEAKMFQEASMNCRLRGGVLAMPKTTTINQILADYISQAGLTRVHVGVKANSDNNGTRSYTYSDSSPLQTFRGWSDSLPSTNSSCVELLSSGTWAHTECDNSMFYICEFPKSRRRGGPTPTLTS
ncbi:collectin-10 isoform X2 [Eucyclogobius newberryi]|uniref:collectin-10 isoform X2 n=1 Tax=Eucyclogobius newberryi TaxID=166745 RepID=UPI003B5C4B6E